MLLEIINIIGILLFVLIILYLFAIMPKLHRNPEGKKLDGWLYAHRGLHDNRSEAPENSLRAFQQAVEHGYGIELDVQLTKDLIPVVLHDYKLKRACKADIKVSEHTYEELRKYKLFRSEERIPTFQEVLDTVNGKVPIIVELKIPWKADQLCTRVSDILNRYQGLYCVESFNTFGLIWYKKHYPKVIRGQLSTDFIREKIAGNKFQYFLLKHLLMNFLAKPDFIAYHHVYKTGLSFTICRKLFRVKTVAWTIQSQEEYENNRKYYELFIFDSFIPKEKDET
ncbi:MAG TPA: glycerophosphodiester phosphodiesterase family protein [Mobilitalea sp.]|nr:glycerophosphodiester phosphodiesterase family protein [Mobilitalea sp.]